METRFRSSFIPKNLSENSLSSREGGGFLSTLANLILILSLLSIGGLFAYKKIIQNSIDNLKMELASLEAAADRQSIDRLIFFDKKISAAREILDQHVALTEFFEILEDKTIRQVVFTSLDYSASAGGKISVKMDGYAPNYATVAEQNKVFSESESFKDVDFSGLSIDSAKGRVKFTWGGLVNKEAVSYNNKIAPDPEPAVETATSTSSAQVQVGGVSEEAETELDSLDN